MPLARTQQAGIVEVPLHDFSGGFTPRLASTEFTERQWAAIEGFVLETHAVLRSQWACQKVGDKAGFKQIGRVDSRFVGIQDDGTVWYRGDVNSALTYDQTRTLPWTAITEVTADPELRILCTVPVKDVNGNFKTALLLNSVDVTSDKAYAISFPGPDVQVWTERFPSGAPTADAMPHGNVGTMWGDFLILGDIRWAETDLASTNQGRFEHGLWFSEGGLIDSYDPINTVFTTPESGISNAVLDMVAIDAGLLVWTGAGTFLLRGNGADFDFEPVRWGMAGRNVGMASYWPHTGAVAWVDNAGQIWHTNGEQFERLDDHLFLDRTAGEYDHACCWQEYVLVEREGRLLVFKAFDDDGAWTELITPDGGVTRSMLPSGDQLYFLDAAGQPWRFNRRDDEVGAERGHVDGVPITSRVATRTVEAGEGHESAMWHRFGFRCEGPGTVRVIRLRPGPALDVAQPTWTVQLDDAAAVRHEQVVRAHGPSVEASAEVEFEGDVQIEQVGFWHHRGRGSR